MPELNNFDAVYENIRDYFRGLDPDPDILISHAFIQGKIPSQYMEMEKEIVDRLIGDGFLRVDEDLKLYTSDLYKQKEQITEGIAEVQFIPAQTDNNTPEYEIVEVLPNPEIHAESDVPTIISVPLTPPTPKEKTLKEKLTDILQKDNYGSAASESRDAKEFMTLFGKAYAKGVDGIRNEMFFRLLMDKIIASEFNKDWISACCKYLDKTSGYFISSYVLYDYLNKYPKELEKIGDKFSLDLLVCYVMPDFWSGNAEIPSPISRGYAELLVKNLKREKKQLGETGKAVSNSEIINAIQKSVDNTPQIKFKNYFDILGLGVQKIKQNEQIYDISPQGFFENATISEIDNLKEQIYAKFPAPRSKDVASAIEILFDNNRYRYYLRGFNAVKTGKQKVAELENNITENIRTGIRMVSDGNTQYKEYTEQDQEDIGFFDESGVLDKLLSDPDAAREFVNNKGMIFIDLRTKYPDAPAPGRIEKIKSQVKKLFKPAEKKQDEHNKANEKKKIEDQKKKEKEKTDEAAAEQEKQKKKEKKETDKAAADPENKKKKDQEKADKEAKKTRKAAGNKDSKSDGKGFAWNGTVVRWGVTILTVAAISALVIYGLTELKSYDRGEPDTSQTKEAGQGDNTQPDNIAPTAPPVPAAPAAPVIDTDSLQRVLNETQARLEAEKKKNDELAAANRRLAARINNASAQISSSGAPASRQTTVTQSSPAPVQTTPSGNIGSQPFVMEWHRTGNVAMLILYANKHPEIFNYLPKDSVTAKVVEGLNNLRNQKTGIR
ncbi:MAG: hypothetical protein FWC61_02205 [Proteobacteria bacterium]|nr:hypothetical protein [Pseudomonadota bacterium]